MRVEGSDGRKSITREPVTKKGWGEEKRETGSYRRTTARARVRKLYHLLKVLKVSAGNAENISQRLKTGFRGLD